MLHRIREQDYSGVSRGIVLLCGWLVLFLGVATAQGKRSPMWGLGWDKDWWGKSGKQIFIVNDINSKSLLTLSRTKKSPAQWQEILAVYAGDTTIPMLGTYRLRPRALEFEPQFPLEPGIRYRAVFTPSKLPGMAKFGIAPMEVIRELPRADTTPKTVVRNIYPSADELPENLLKFYLHFSAPMQRGNIYEHIHLRDSRGKNVALPFLEIDEELWDTTLTRLTLFIDPGRIKRGVLPLEEIGPSLEAGKSYSLVIDRAWKDGAGNPLKEDFQKPFRVAAADREAPDPARWQLTLPTPGTLIPLKVNFTEPMDHALAQRVLTVVAESGQRMDGTVTMTEQERVWLFTPGTAWQRGKYNLVIQTTLEDLAGNNIGKPFEVDRFEGIERYLHTPTVRLPFDIR